MLLIASVRATNIRIIKINSNIIYTTKCVAKQQQKIEGLDALKSFLTLLCISYIYTTRVAANRFVCFFVLYLFRYLFYHIM